ncbi:hypothetical protein WOSG25_050240 [Weissella oryzae SG25]|uniref:Uncharacterized protein n=1 Tax=Weissella oryzae (strain DSM 25784 / JCM 18191 / LMG 30913 / SG25) TaxID=1329250 RepID=A0A069CTN2_WEIOS|nr:hypothetical protein [Weissella oryzae]GAK30752.1 hypothetical protein WOSG25_050240 [Weissella oryzae SG25]
MRADYVDIRFKGKTRRFRYPIRKNEFLTWVTVQKDVYLENLALVGYQLPDKVIKNLGKNLTVENLLPISGEQLSDYNNYRYWGAGRMAIR